MLAAKRHDFRFKPRNSRFFLYRFHASSLIYPYCLALSGRLHICIAKTQGDGVNAFALGYFTTAFQAVGSGLSHVRIFYQDYLKSLYSFR